MTFFVERYFADMTPDPNLWAVPPSISQAAPMVTAAAAGQNKPNPGTAQNSRVVAFSDADTRARSHSGATATSSGIFDPKSKSNDEWSEDALQADKGNEKEFKMLNNSFAFSTGQLEEDFDFGVMNNASAFQFGQLNPDSEVIQSPFVFSPGQLENDFEFIQSPFAFSPGHLNKLYNPGSLAAPNVHGMQGFAKGFQPKHLHEAAPNTRSSTYANTRELVWLKLGIGEWTGGYSCTYHGCQLRFETPAKLQKHKREGHRQMSPSIRPIVTLKDGSEELTSMFDNTLRTPLREGDSHHSRRPRAARSVLPIMVNGQLYDAMPDTMSSANIITEAHATKLGVSIDRSRRQTFLNACGKTFQSVGEATINVSFPDDTEGVWPNCRFAVLEHCAMPLIMGDPFLKLTETLTKFRHRLRKVASSLRKLLESMLYGPATADVGLYYRRTVCAG